MKKLRKKNTWNVRHLVYDLFVPSAQKPAYHIVDCRICRPSSSSIFKPDESIGLLYVLYIFYETKSVFSIFKNNTNIKLCKIGPIWHFICFHRSIVRS